MASPQAHHTRRLARTFTPTTPKHHPLLDPSLQQEDISLVPRDLAPRGQLNWELPKKARTNLHVVLKLSNKADEILDDFYDKVPRIDEVLNEWAEMRGASPTKTGHEQLRSQSMHHDGFDTANQIADQDVESDEYVFHMVRNLDTPGRADVIYLTEAMEEADPRSRRPENAPPNIRGIDWLDFDGSYMHLDEPQSAFPEPLRLSQTQATDSPPNPRTTEWISDQEMYLSPSVYNSPFTAEVPEVQKQTGPFETFWRDQGHPWPQVVLRSSDDGEMSTHGAPQLTPMGKTRSCLELGQQQNPAHLMVPAQDCISTF